MYEWQKGKTAATVVESDVSLSTDKKNKKNIVYRVRNNAYVMYICHCPYVDSFMFSVARQQLLSSLSENFSRLSDYPNKAVPTNRESSNGDGRMPDGQMGLSLGHEVGAVDTLRGIYISSVQLFLLWCFFVCMCFVVCVACVCVCV